MRETELFDARAALCDLLVGRSFRLRAQQQLDLAIYLEKHSLTDAEDLLVQAAHMEWLASISEQGKVRWGGRLNRCGYQPEFEVVNAP